MYFKLSYSIRQINFLKSEEIIIFSDQKIEIRFYRPSAEDINRGAKHDTVFCDATIEFNPNKKNLELLNRIIERKPLGFITNESRGYKITNENPQYFVPHFSAFPEHFVTFYNSLHEIIKNAIKTVVNKIAWLHNSNISHNPYAFRRFEFSPDNKKWDDMPMNMNVSVSIGEIPLVISNDARKFISSSTVITPIHHSLFLEAWSQRKINERSALIMGLAALEGAIKYMIVKNNPDSAWLVENSPSPSVQAMLSEMIKTLPIKNKIDGQIKTLSKITFDDLRKWISVRNKLIHKGAELPKTFKIEIILKTIKSIIYLMDYYSGEKWALIHVNKEIFES